MGVTKKRKRLRVLSQASEDDTPEEVGEFEENDFEDSDFESPQVKRHSQQSQPKVNAIRLDANEKGSCAVSWVARYADISVQSGLATSTRKRKEIASWLQDSLSGNASRMLVLAGPPGCGKSSTILAVAKEMRCEIVEWQAPPAGTRGISHFLLEDFRSFLVGGRYPTLNRDDFESIGDDHDQTSKVIVVQDFPISTSDMAQHRNMLQQTFSELARFSPHPVVVILSDSDREIARAARLILGSDLLQSSNVTMIKVSPVTDAMMKRRLREVLAMEHMYLAENKLLDVIYASKGDIRSALNVLQLCTNGHGWNHDTMNDCSHRPQRRSLKRLKPATSTNLTYSGMVGQDPTLGMYHAVSKVLNNKRREDGSSKYVAEDILEDTRADPSSFLSFLHHNYPDFFGDINNAVDALDCLSSADCLLQWKQDDLVRTSLGDCAASVVTRGFLMYNSSPIQEGWRPIRGPDSYAVARESKESVMESREQYARVLSPCVFTRSTMSEVVPFAHAVLKSTTNRRGTTTQRFLGSHIPLVDAAEVAIADVEASHEEAALVSAVNTTRDDTLKYTSKEDTIEDIDDWSDDE